MKYSNKGCTVVFHGLSLRLKLPNSTILPAEETMNTGGEFSAKNGTKFLTRCGRRF